MEGEDEGVKWVGFTPPNTNSLSFWVGLPSHDTAITNFTRLKKIFHLSQSYCLDMKISNE